MWSMSILASFRNSKIEIIFLVILQLSNNISVSTFHFGNLHLPEMVRCEKQIQNK
jgi:hypothetical protein